MTPGAAGDTTRGPEPLQSLCFATPNETGPSGAERSAGGGTRGPERRRKGARRETPQNRGPERLRRGRNHREPLFCDTKRARPEKSLGAFVLRHQMKRASGAISGVPGGRPLRLESRNRGPERFRGGGRETPVAQVWAKQGCERFRAIPGWTGGRCGSASPGMEGKDDFSTKTMKICCVFEVPAFGCFRGALVEGFREDESSRRGEAHALKCSANKYSRSACCVRNV